MEFSFKTYAAYAFKKGLHLLLCVFFVGFVVPLRVDETLLWQDLGRVAHLATWADREHWLDVPRWFFDLFSLKLLGLTCQISEASGKNRKHATL